MLIGTNYKRINEINNNNNRQVTQDARPGIHLFQPHLGRTLRCPTRASENPKEAPDPPCHP